MFYIYFKDILKKPQITLKKRDFISLPIVILHMRKICFFVELEGTVNFLVCQHH